MLRYLDGIYKAWRKINSRQNKKRQIKHGKWADNRASKMDK